MKPKILSIRIEHKVDEDPDTSDLGKYSDAYSGVRDEWAIVRIGEHAGKFINDTEDFEPPTKCREHRFFLPNVGSYFGMFESELREYCLQDYERMEALNRGDWNYLGVIAKAEIQLADGSPIQTIHSGGLWGVESDSGDYLKEVAREQLAELKTELLAIGFKKRAIEYAFGKVEL